MATWMIPMRSVLNYPHIMKSMDANGLSEEKYVWKVSHKGTYQCFTLPPPSHCLLSPSSFPLELEGFASENFD